MRGIRSSTRHEIVRRVLGPHCRLTVGQADRAFRRMRERGWLTAMSPDGPAFEKVAFVREDHPIAAVVASYGTGVRRFARTVLGGLSGAPIAELKGAVNLAKAGFAVAGTDGEWVELRATDPRAGRLVNEARCGSQARGFGVRRVVEAFLSVRNPKRTRVNVNDDRRLLAAEALHDFWGIECDDLLVGRARVRLLSAWTYEAA
jgi:hypothetical protein